MDDPIVLEAGEARVEIAVGAGGRIAQVFAGGEPLLIAPGTDPTSTGWGSFPMAPWAGRIRNGRFRFLGTDHRLETNQQDGADGDPARRHAMHGTVFTRPWRVGGIGEVGEVGSAPDRSFLEMSCELTGALGWPFPGTARQRIELGPHSLWCELSVETSGGPFPAEIGWHPWFCKPERVDFAPLAMYRRDATGVPTGELVAPTAGPWDDCFVNVEPVVLHYARRQAPVVTVASDCDHWVVFDEPADATCVEPQSGPPDAFTIRPRLAAAGKPLRRTMTIGW